ncbi:MAG TPA: hypothetical protein VMQ52_01955 [Candidatus Saccharimonadales bacterium]|jgi:hypothetical protein|nr:hypothetical protein [Candidatus Saccharimonadales bacterium]
MNPSNPNPSGNINPSQPADRGAPGALHPSDYYHHQKTNHGKRLIGIVAGLIIIVLCGVIVAGYEHYHKKTATGPPVVSSLPATTKIGLPAATQQYSSTNLGLSFNYPPGWKITDTAGTNVLTLQSPSEELLTTPNQLVKGKITMTIQNQAPAVIAGYQSGNASAALESQLITYTNPTAGQRASTYISFLHYATSTSTPASNIDAIYITGNSGYQLSQYIPLADIQAVSPVVGITFNRCANTACLTSGPASSITSSSWNTTSFSGTLLTLLKSLSID